MQERSKHPSQSQKSCTSLRSTVVHLLVLKRKLWLLHSFGVDRGADCLPLVRQRQYLGGDGVNQLSFCSFQFPSLAFVMELETDTVAEAVVETVGDVADQLASLSLLPDFDFRGPFHHTFLSIFKF